jgi:hypothetical protein
MPERIPATAWFPPQEPADCSVCREAQAALTPGGLAVAGDLALAFLARGQAVPILAVAVTNVTPVVAGGRVSVLVPELGGKWRVFASSSGHETHDLMVDPERYPELSEVRRTSAPYLAPDVANAPELKTAQLFLEAAGVRGLAIVGRLVLAMGGRVWAESIPGKGSSLFVELPLWTGAG